MTVYEGIHRRMNGKNAKLAGTARGCAIFSSFNVTHSHTLIFCVMWVWVIKACSAALPLVPVHTVVTHSKNYIILHLASHLPAKTDEKGSLWSWRTRNENPKMIIDETRLCDANDQMVCIYDRRFFSLMITWFHEKEVVWVELAEFIQSWCFSIFERVSKTTLLFVDIARTERYRQK